MIREVPARRSGFVTAIDGEALGLAVVRLGGGRQVESDTVDPAVGLSGIARLGTRIDKGQPLAVIHAAREDAADAAAVDVIRAITLADAPQPVPDLIRERINA